jgi:hypothetical protein
MMLKGAPTMDLLPHLPPSVVRQALASLSASLPPPPVDTPEQRAERDEGAMYAVAAIEPADAFEIRLAVEILVADARAMSCYQCSEQPDVTPADRHRLTAEAAGHLRHVRATTLILARRHAKREKAEAVMHPKAMERAGYWFRDVSVPGPEPALAPPEPRRSFEQMDEAEQYAVLYPQRAAAIRAHRGLPPNCTFGPPEPVLIERIVNSDSTVLRELDQPVAAGAD